MLVRSDFWLAPRRMQAEQRQVWRNRSPKPKQEDDFREILGSHFDLEENDLARTDDTVQLGSWTTANPSNRRLKARLPISFKCILARRTRICARQTLNLVGRCLANIVILVSLLANSPLLHAQTGSTPDLNWREAFGNDEVDVAIDQGLAYLVSQQRADGAITDRQYDTTMTSLALMALASTGVTPSSPDDRGAVARRALDFVLRNDRQDDKGYYGNRDGSRMYGHGITTLMLTEMLGMGGSREQDELTYLRCRKAIDLILRAQQVSKPSQYRGGWRYTPSSNDSDLSVSVWQLMALRSAKNDGLEVPATAIGTAVEYLKHSFTGRVNKTITDPPAAGFSYLPNRRAASFAMTSAGLLAMQVCGQYEAPEVIAAAKWLEQNPPKWKERFFFYGLYYYAQGMHQRGGAQADTAEKAVRNLLLDRQNPDGSWSAPGGEEAGTGRVYTTAMAILSLSVKHHVLPIYQK